MTFLDRIKETSTSTGTGTFTLGGAVLGYKVFTNGTYKYCIVNETESEWEVGEGTVSSSVLTRTTIEASSNGGAAVSFSAGTKYVFNTVSAAYVNSLVPYTGATASVNLGAYGLTSDYLQLSTSPTASGAVGRTLWNDSIGSTETTLKGGSVVLKNGVDLVARVVNKVTPAATLTKATYKAVRVSGAQGQRLAIAYAQANTDNNSADTIGLVCETIAANQEGFIITVGQLTGINTTGSLQGETWADGDVLYLSPTTAGNLTNIKPTGATGHIVVIGYVEYAHAINGSIYVKIMNGWELSELHDTYINAVANNDVLVYESSSTLWKNKSIATILGYTPQAQLNGTGFVKATGTTISYDNTTYATDSLVVHLASAENITGVKTFQNALQTTSGDNLLNTGGGNTYVGYTATTGTPLKFNVKDSIRVEYTANRFVDIKVNPSLGDYAYLQATNTTGFSIVSSGTLFLRPNDASNTIYFGSYIRQQDITASALYGSSSLTGRGFEVGTNVPMVFKTTIDAGGGVVGGFIFHSTDNANFAHRVTASTTSLQTIKTTGQLQLHNYTSTSVFTGTVAGLLGFDSSGNVITSAAGVTGSGTAGQVTYWSGTSAVTGSATLTYTPTTSLLVNNSVTASGAIARGINFTPTLTAAANLDFLIGLDITPTFSSSGFTTITNVGIRSTVGGGNAQMPTWAAQFINNTNVTSNHGVLIQNTHTTDTSYALLINAGGANNVLSIRGNRYLWYNGGNAYFGNFANASARVHIRGGATEPSLIVENSSGTSSLQVQANQNVLLGTNSDGGQRLQVIGSMRVGTTAASAMYWDDTNARLIIGNTSGTARLDVGASTTSAASLRIRSGTAPTTPNDGDIWQDGTNIKIYIGGSTKTFTII